MKDKRFQFYIPQGDTKDEVIRNIIYDSAEQMTRKMRDEISQLNLRLAAYKNHVDFWKQRYQDSLYERSQTETSSQANDCAERVLPSVRLPDGYSLARLPYVRSPHAKKRWWKVFWQR